MRHEPALLNYKQLEIKTHTMTTHKTKDIRITDLTKKTGSDPGSPEREAVVASYKIPAVLLIQSSPVTVLTVMEQRKSLRKK